MAKFKNGDRVKLIADMDGEGLIPLGSTGTVNEDHSSYPYVSWDYVNDTDVEEEDRYNYIWAVDEDEMELTDEQNQNINTNYEIY